MVAMSRDDAPMSMDDVGMGSQDHMQPEVSNEASTSTTSTPMDGGMQCMFDKLDIVDDVFYDLVILRKTMLI
jgi:hypothetical protein